MLAMEVPDGFVVVRAKGGRANGFTLAAESVPVLIRTACVESFCGRNVVMSSGDRWELDDRYDLSGFLDAINNGPFGSKGSPF